MELNPGLCNNLEGWDGVGGRREVQEGGDVCICLWLIPVDVWQKPTQFCEAIILQLKNKLIKREREGALSPRGTGAIRKPEEESLRTRTVSVLTGEDRKAVTMGTKTAYGVSVWTGCKEDDKSCNWPSGVLLRHQNCCASQNNLLFSLRSGCAAVEGSSSSVHPFNRFHYPEPKYICSLKTERG